MKKGEISTSFLVGVILVVMSGIVLLLVFTSFPWQPTSDESVCKTSVLLRGTVPDVAKGFTPLNCKTEKICITAKDSSSKNSCENLFMGVEGIEIEKVSSKEFVSEGKMDAKTEIEKIISKKVIECWDMMGSGKISIENSEISKSYGLGDTTSFCVVCSRIDVDQSLLEHYAISRENLSQINPFEYMRTRKYAKTDGSYLDYIIGGGSNGRGAAFGADSYFESIATFDNSTKEQYADRKKNFEQIAIVFSQAYAPEASRVWNNYLNTLLIGGIAANSITPNFLKVAAGKAVTTLGLTGGIVAGAVFALAAGAIQMNVWNNQALTASYCGDLTISDGSSKKGCSVVRVMPYNATDLTTFCGVIDGLP